LSIDSSVASVVRRPDACARKHRDDRLGNHRQEDPHDVALADAARLERVGETLDIAVQVGVGDRALLALLAAPEERDAIAVALLDVPVDAVIGRVQRAAGEPPVKRWIRLGQDRVPPPLGAPRPGVAAQERGARALLAAEAERAVEQARDEPLEADRHLDQAASEVCGDAVDDAAGDERLADADVVVPVARSPKR
jgi:hypothetical protein